VPNPDLASRAMPAIEELVGENLSQTELFAKLGARLQMNKSNPETVDEFNASEPEYETLGLRDDLTAFGEKYFNRINRLAYNLFCSPDAEETAEREKVLAAFSLGKTEVAPALAALLVSQLAIAPAIAAVVAALVIKFFFAPAHEAMCEVWTSKLPAREH
jgi:hypothetical protein